MNHELCPLAQEECRLFYTVCAYAYEYLDLTLIPDAWWDRGMRAVAPELASTGMWVREVGNHKELKQYALQMDTIMKRSNRREALHTMLFKPELW